MGTQRFLVLLQGFWYEAYLRLGEISVNQFEIQFVVHGERHAASSAACSPCPRPISSQIIHDDPNWMARSCQFYAVSHALQHVNYPNPARDMDLSLRSKTWLLANHALVSPFLTNTSEAEWKQRCKNYGWVGSNMLPGDQFTLMAMATELRCNINAYQGFHPIIQSPLGGVEALYDIDICLITDLHYKSIVKVNQEEQIGVASEAAEHDQAAVSDAEEGNPLR